MSQAGSARKDREVAWLRRLWAVESPGHPGAATLREHYRHQLGLLRDKRLFHVVMRDALNERGRWLLALADDAMEREVDDPYGRRNRDD